MNALFTAGLCVLLAGQGDAAVDVGVPAPLESHSPATLAGPTAELVALLQDAFNARPGHAGPYQYWMEDDRYDWFWTRVVSLLDQGADPVAAHQHGASVWNVAFVADPRCLPIEGDGGRTIKTRGPQHVRGCLRVERNNLRQRIATLLAHGVDPRLAVLDGWSKPMGSPLCFAMGAGIWEGVDALIAKQASCQAPCRDNSVLHRVADLDNPMLTCKLIVCGAEVNAKDGLGDTPLILAAKHGDAKNVSILLDYGADAAVRDQRGESAMSLAVRLGRRSVVRVLGAWAKQGAITRSLCRP